MGASILSSVPSPRLAGRCLPDFDEAAGWGQQLRAQLEAPYMQGLFARLDAELNAANGRDAFYPSPPLVFNAFTRTPFADVRVVMVGQDPYHGLGQAHGLCFSVPKGCRLPPSLRNIFRELEDDVGAAMVEGDLTGWASQGVLLLNTVLTVRPGSAGSHRGWGWETFTDAVISTVATQRPESVFVLWGNAAQAKRALLPRNALVIEAPHPSPLSAHRGFFGSRPFSLINKHLAQRGQAPVDWTFTVSD